MALNMFGKNLAHEEQGGHGRRPTSTDTPSPQKHMVVLRRPRSDITIEIPWCPAHKGVPENEKADE
jgi:ribonuclease HI